MPKYVVCTKYPNLPLDRGAVSFVTAPTPAEAAALALAYVGDARAKYRVLALNQSQDFSVADAQTFTFDDSAGTVVQKTRAEIDALKAADAGV